MLHKEYNLSKTVFKITRSGADKQTTYQFMPAKQGPSDEMLKALATIDLIELDPDKSSASGTDDDGGSEVPF
jgi:hypothetical protein